MVPSAVWSFSGCQFGASDGQHVAQDIQLGVQDSPTWRTEPVLRVSRRASGTTQSAQRRPEMIFRGFESIFRSFSTIKLVIRFFVVSRSVLRRVVLMRRASSSELAIDDSKNLASQKQAARSTSSIFACALCGRFVLHPWPSKNPRLTLRCDLHKPT